MAKITNTLAKTEDGTIQITFNIPFPLISKTKEEVLKEYAKDMEIPGFRKGNAPIDKVEEKIPQDSLVEHTLRHILPKALAEAINEHKLKLAIYPKFELISKKENEDWQIRAVSCELPNFELGNYKKTIQGAARTGSIWTPGKGKLEESHFAKASRDEKEQMVIKALLETIKVSVPKILIDEEVNTRLAGLLEKIEKLGLSLESYLASIGKTAQTIRTDYEDQAREAISLDLILNKIADEEKITIEEGQIDEAIKASSADPKLAEKLNTPEQRRIILSVLRRKASLDSQVSLI